MQQIAIWLNDINDINVHRPKRIVFKLQCRYFLILFKIHAVAMLRLQQLHRLP